MARVRHTGPQNPYESFCYACNVTAPVDARSCLHCGGRMSKQRDSAASITPLLFSGQALEEGERDAPRRLGSASPMTAVWILLFLAGTLYRLCA